MFPRLLLNDGDGGTQTSHILTAAEGTGVIRFGSASGEGTAIIGQASTAARRIALLFPDDAISGPDASAAGDGFANLLRYGHRVGPYDPLQALLPQLDPAAGGGLDFRVRIATGKPDLAWLVRASPDLNDWTETLFDSRVDPTPPDAGGWSEITVPADRSRLFLRLELLLELLLVSP